MQFFFNKVKKIGYDSGNQTRKMRPVFSSASFALGEISPHGDTKP